MAITLRIETDTDALLTLEGIESAVLHAEATTYVDTAGIYDGSYEWTPTQQTQTIPIAGEKAITDITINPIPSNYGLITWDGSTLTVS